MLFRSFKSEKSFQKYEKECEDTIYTRYFIKKPLKYPCIGIENWELDGKVGEELTMDTYVYLEDFDERCV